MVEHDSGIGGCARASSLLRFCAVGPDRNLVTQHARIGGTAGRVSSGHDQQYGPEGPARGHARGALMAISDLVHSVVARKGPLFLVNHLVLGPIAIWLAIEIAVADGFHRSPQFAARLTALGCVAIFAYLSLVLGRRGKARLLPCFIATGLIAEILLRALPPFGASGDLNWREAR